MLHEIRWYDTANMISSSIFVPFGSQFAQRSELPDDLYSRMHVIYFSQGLSEYLEMVFGSYPTHSVVLMNTIFITVLLFSSLHGR